MNLCQPCQRPADQVPDEKVLDELVYKYSWPLFPYIWNEVKFQIGYNADLEFVASTMQRIIEEELGREMIERVKPFATCSLARLWISWRCMSTRA